MKNINAARIKSIISNFRSARVMVIGDLILDEFIWGKVDRISPEAPVPVVWADKQSFMPGGASNVANNIASLGGNVGLVGVVGDDEKGGILKGELNLRSVKTDGVIVDAARPTIVKTRVIAHKQQVVRIDKEHLGSLHKDVAARLLAYVKAHINDVDMVIIEDYGKGTITPQILKKIIPLAKRSKKLIAVDPKEDHFSYYKGVTFITPNANEASRATGIKLNGARDIDAIGKALLKRLKCKMVLITLGENGMALFKDGKRPIFIPTIAQEVYDVSGAGDTVIGTFALSLISGARDIEAAHMANCAAGIVVSKIGTAVVSREELKDRMIR